MAWNNGEVDSSICFFLSESVPGPAAIVVCISRQIAIMADKIKFLNNFMRVSVLWYYIDCLDWVWKRSTPVSITNLTSLNSHPKYRLRFHPYFHRATETLLLSRQSPIVHKCHWNIQKLSSQVRIPLSDTGLCHSHPTDVGLKLMATFETCFSLSKTYDFFDRERTICCHIYIFLYML